LSTDCAQRWWRKSEVYVGTGGF